MLTNILPSLLIGLAGAAGTLLRYWVGLATLRWSQLLPWGTIAINVSGSFAIAFFGTLTAAGGRCPCPKPEGWCLWSGYAGGTPRFPPSACKRLTCLKTEHPAGTSQYRSVCRAVHAQCERRLRCRAGHKYRKRHRKLIYKAVFLPAPTLRPMAAGAG